MASPLSRSGDHGTMVGRISKRRHRERNRQSEGIRRKLGARTTQTRVVLFPGSRPSFGFLEVRYPRNCLMQNHLGPRDEVGERWQGNCCLVVHGMVSSFPAEREWRGFVLHLVSGKTTGFSRGVLWPEQAEESSRRVCAPGLPRLRWRLSCSDSFSVAGLRPRGLGLVGAFEGALSGSSLSQRLFFSQARDDARVGTRR